MKMRNNKSILCMATAMAALLFVPAGGMALAVHQPKFGSGLRNVLIQIPSTAADYPNKDSNSVKFLDVNALKGGEFNHVHITGTLLSLRNKTLWYPAPIVYL